MRAHIQRVSQAAVHIDGREQAAIKTGLLILLGVAPADEDADIEWLVQKISKLRIFTDEQGKMNKSVNDVSGSVIVVSQFTLFANCKKGTRPAFTGAAEPEKAKALYELFVQRLNVFIPDVQTGVFAADMAVSLINDGPVTLLLDTAAKG